MEQNVDPAIVNAALNLIFACDFCSKPFNEIYENQESVYGLSDGINPRDRCVTKCYLADCNGQHHVFCSKHLESGAPPFHPEGQQPRAPCPVCVMDRHDNTPRDLFSVRGFRKGEYDPSIPASYFAVPPRVLERADQVTKWQYQNMLKWATSAQKQLDELNGCALDLGKVRTELDETQRQLDETKDKLASTQRTLEHRENALQAFGPDWDTHFDRFNQSVQNCVNLREEKDKLELALWGLKELHDQVPMLDQWIGYLAYLDSQYQTMKSIFESEGRHFPIMQLEEWKRGRPTQETNSRSLSLERSLQGSLGKYGKLSIGARNANPSLTAYSLSPRGGRVSPIRESRSMRRSTIDNHLHRPDPLWRCATKDSTVDRRPSSKELMPPPALPLHPRRSLRDMETVSRNNSTGRARRPRSSSRSSTLPPSSSSSGSRSVLQRSPSRNRSPSGSFRGFKGAPQSDFPADSYDIYGNPNTRVLSEKDEKISQAYGENSSGHTRDFSPLARHSTSSSSHHPTDDPCVDATMRPLLAVDNDAGPWISKQDPPRQTGLVGSQSFMRLMDNISAIKGLDLSLRDPREDTRETPQTSQTAQFGDQDSFVNRKFTFEAPARLPSIRVPPRVPLPSSAFVGSTPVTPAPMQPLPTTPIPTRPLVRRESVIGRWVRKAKTLRRKA
ncbi:hypothetical protein GQ43DRAFT_469254 [Delitschia confertaspora ATCC 74209]|uniref:Uncharacterized protein n=1 Tax=Delitschia confertaspora ATCC 74209 TaxID=1513339 RepID=A0A9P4JS74_9PLEO|nr:hypothetical protein GQ43DRAFT_469254 [Delitschia confertaspora ATCC 74209]